MHPEDAQRIGQRAHQMAISEMAVLDRLYALLQQRGFLDENT